MAEALDQHVTYRIMAKNFFTARQRIVNDEIEPCVIIEQNNSDLKNSENKNNLHKLMTDEIIVILTMV